MQERIEFALMPDYQYQRTAWLCYPQHFAQSSQRIGKEHYSQSTNHGIKKRAIEWQRISGALPETYVCYASSLCFALRGGNHFCHRVRISNRTFWPKRLCDS